MSKPILLGIAVVLITGAIWYLEAGKVSPTAGIKGDVLTPETVTSVATTSATMNGSTTPSRTNTNTNTDTVHRVAEKAKLYPSARELVPGGGFINTDPFTLKSLIGKKVILIDFWTYSCINCKRTIPYLNAWYAKYKDAGLVVIGVHTPEFNFEKVYDNVAKAVTDLGIHYPVVQDNDYATWKTYENNYWPREYLIDIDGYIVHDHIGEGGYDETERAIQAALTERAQVLGVHTQIPSGIANPTDAVTMDSSKVQSPETYFGAARNIYLANGEGNVSGSQELVIPPTILPNKLYLGGTWSFVDEFAQNATSSAKIVYTYTAKNVYMVASAATPVDITIMLDGVVQKHEMIQANKLYQLVNGSAYGEHTLEILINGAGLQAYTFTFG